MIDDLVVEIALGYADGRMPQSYYLPRDRWVGLRNEYMRVTKEYPFVGEVPFSFKIMGVDIAPMDVLESMHLYEDAQIQYEREWKLAN